MTIRAVDTRNNCCLQRFNVSQMHVWIVDIYLGFPFSHDNKLCPSLMAVMSDDYFWAHRVESVVTQNPQLAVFLPEGIIVNYWYLHVFSLRESGKVKVSH